MLGLDKLTASRKACFTQRNFKQPVSRKEEFHAKKEFHAKRAKEQRIKSSSFARFFWRGS